MNLDSDERYAGGVYTARVTVSGIVEHAVILVDLQGVVIGGYAHTSSAFYAARRIQGQFDVYEYVQKSGNSSGWSWCATFSDGRCIHRKKKHTQAQATSVGFSS